jgi:hypothetical protein
LRKYHGCLVRYDDCCLGRYCANFKFERIRHIFPSTRLGGDITATLIAPGGTPSFVLFGRRGATTTATCGSSNDLAGPYVFSDAATGNFFTVAGNPTPAGSYRTSEVGATATGGTATNFTAAFSGLTTAQINGNWTLRFQDTGVGDTGTVSAASLTITAGSGGGNSWAASPNPLTVGATTAGGTAVTANLALTGAAANTATGSIPAACAITGANAASFSVTNTFPQTLAQTGVTNLQVRFAPAAGAAAGAQTASISCTGAAGTTLTGFPVTLNGTVNAGASNSWAATPNPLSVGATTAGGTAVTANLALTGAAANTATGSIPAACAITGANAASFSVTNTFPQTLAQTGVTNLQVLFAPATGAAAGAQTASISCTGAAGTTLTGFPVTLNGTVNAAAAQAVTAPTSSAAAPINVGTTTAGTQIGPFNVAVSAPAANTGPVQITSCTAITSTPAGLFNYGTPAPTFPITIAAGATVNIPVFYNPPAGAAAGQYNGQFTCQTNGTPASFDVFVRGAVGAPSPVTVIPTLSQWGQLLMFGMLLGFGMWSIRRQS